MLNFSLAPGSSLAYIPQQGGAAEFLLIAGQDSWVFHSGYEQFPSKEASGLTYDAPHTLRQ